MTNRMMDNKIKKLQAIEAQQKELEARAEAIISELKAELDANDKEPRSFVSEYMYVKRKYIFYYSCKIPR